MARWAGTVGAAGVGQGGPQVATAPTPVGSLAGGLQNRGRTRRPSKNIQKKFVRFCGQVFEKVQFEKTRTRSVSDLWVTEVYPCRDFVVPPLGPKLALVSTVNHASKTRAESRSNFM